MALSGLRCAALVGVLAGAIALVGALPRAGDNALAQSLQGVAGSSEEGECLQFLVDHMPESDRTSLSVDYVLTNVQLALATRNSTAWARDIPWDVFLNFVLPYASLAEPRDNWRPLFHTSFAPLVANTTSIADAALVMNAESWKIVDPPIKFVAAPPDELNQYSPFQVMAAHNASCTGLSVFLVDALRSVGVPARVAGVPHWNRPSCKSDMDPDCGNHDWVEVWADGDWAFVDQDTSNALNSSWFFPSPVKYQVPNSLNHSVYATSWKPTGKFFPMVWDWDNHVVPAFDVTSFYTDMLA